MEDAVIVGVNVKARHRGVHLRVDKQSRIIVLFFILSYFLKRLFANTRVAGGEAVKQEHDCLHSFQTNRLCTFL